MDFTHGAGGSICPRETKDSSDDTSKTKPGEAAPGDVVGSQEPELFVFNMVNINIVSSSLVG